MPTVQQQYLTYSMNYLMRYPTSTGLFVRKLRGKFPEISEEDITVVVDTVTRQRILDDTTYGKAVAATLVRRKSASFLLITIKLQTKLLSKQVIAEVLQSLREDVDEEALCLQAGMKKWKVLVRSVGAVDAKGERKPLGVQENKLRGYLLRKGFSSGVVGKVVTLCCRGKS